MSRQEQIAKLREVLVARRDALRRALAGDLSALSEVHDQASGDEVDFALSTSHTEITSQLAGFESRELAQIENAIDRMREGTYGVCEITGKQIPLARLQALPYTTVTIEAQRQMESGQYSPDEDAPMPHLNMGGASYGVGEFA